MAIHQRAGQIANQTDLVNIPKLMSHYYSITPNMDDVQQRVTFGTSGHRGCAFNGSFNQQHIWAITQAVVDYRQSVNINGPLILGIDTHALSYAAYLSAIEVLAANKVTVHIQQNDGFTPTPVVSHGVICANREANITGAPLSDGLIITPSHNPPQDGGIKYNPPHGGPAEGNITAWIESRANDYLRQALAGVQKLAYAEALASGYVNAIDLVTPYVADLENVIDMQAIANAKLRIGVDPLGGSGIFYWAPIAARYGLDITLVNDKVDPSFSFMPLDKDGKIRMDCSSPYAMAGLLAHKESFDLCLGNDPDYDRHGIVCHGTGLMDPNHYLAVAIDYLLTHRPDWSDTLAIGKTLVSSALIDKICAFHGKKLLEVPVGFKWFVDGLAEATIAFGGEESAGAAFLRRDGTTWCTDKDGFILAVTGKTPGQRHQELVKQFGQSFYKRIDSPISLENKAKFALLNAETLNATVLAGEAIENVLTHAPGNNAAIGGIKVTTANGWFAARPSGTEALFKIYGESFISEQHLAEIIKDAQALIDKALNA